MGNNSLPFEAGVNYRQELQDRGCLYLGMDSQFIGISGKHLEGYCNIDPALPDVAFMQQATDDLVAPLVDDEVETIFVPAIGAIPLGHLAAARLMQINGGNVMAVWADKIQPRGFRVERRGFRAAIAGRRVAILEDMINQRFSAGSLIGIARDAGAEVVAVNSIAANAGVNVENLSVPKFHRLCEVAYRAWEPDECRRSGPCSEGWPIVINEALGHGAAYQQQFPDYAGGYITLPEV